MLALSATQYCTLGNDLQQGIKETNFTSTVINFLQPFILRARLLASERFVPINIDN